MITAIRFHEIKDEVHQAVIEAFDYAAMHNDEKYILWLADSEYNPDYENTNISPYVLSSMIDYYKEHARFSFSEFYLNKMYSFGTGVTQSDDQPFWLQMEMMIYCHVWESNKFLKQLFRLREIVNGRTYAWKVDIPETSKQKFIRLTIRDGFGNKGLKLAEVMRKGYHVSLRNSFLHSEYEIDAANSKIMLHTHRVGRKQPFELDEITFNDWTERFMYTVLLNYFFINEKEKRRKNVLKDFGTDEFKVVWPTRHGFSVITIYYDESRGSFAGVRSEPYIPNKNEPVTPTTPRVEIEQQPPVTKEVLQNLEQQMKASVMELMNKLVDGDQEKYIMWLYDIRYDDITSTYISKVDEESTRLSFSAALLQEIYIDSKVKLPELIRMQMEMQVYSHIWESKPLLKQLRSAGQILVGEQFNWNDELDDDRRELINDIVQKFSASTCSLATLIDQGFHTSLRNAFAHSEYDIDVNNKEIYLDTFKAERADWDIRKITYMDWQAKFLISIALDYQLIIAREYARKEISPETVQQVLDLLNNPRP